MSDQLGVSDVSHKLGAPREVAEAGECRARRKPDAIFGPRSRAARTGLQLREGLTFEAWCRVGSQVSALADASAWWIGDWLVYGQRTYPDRYRDAIGLTGLSYQTLRNYAWVASQFPFYRRRESLSFGHHAELAALSPDEQEVWLTRAIANGWTRNQLRGQLRQPTGPLLPAVAIALQVERARHERWQAAAIAEERPLSAWIVEVLDAASTARLAAVERAA
jgi:hypothetical protein